MKRFITPAILFALVFAVSAIFQKFTFCQREALGLFLLAPDYIHEVFSSALPLSQLLSDFLTQMFRFVWAGPFIMASAITLFFLMFRAICRKMTLPSDLLSTFAASLLWWFSARSETFVFPCAAILFTLVLFVLSRFIHSKPSVENTLWMKAVYIAIMIAVPVSLIFNPNVKKQELRSKVEFYALHAQWDKLLEAASPEVVAKDHSLIQFALLALSCSDKLGERMFEYDIDGAQDLDAEGINNREGYYYSSIYAECTGCPNEALHNIFQANAALPHGVSFRGLRQMVQYNYELGDSLLVEKYCSILDRSLCNGKFTALYRSLPYVRGVADTTANLSYKAPVSDHNKKYELIEMYRSGHSSRLIAERILCYQLAEGDLDSFRSNLQLFIPYYREVPRHFLEAMDLQPTTPEYGDNLYYRYIEKMNRNLEK